MSKYIHRAKTLPAIPMDYYERWDASTSDGMTLTGSALTSWVGQCASGVKLDKTGSGTATWTPGQVHLDGGCYLIEVASVLADQDKSVFVAGQVVNTGSTVYHGLFFGPGMYSILGNSNGSSKLQCRTFSGGWTNRQTSTNNLTDIPVASGATFSRTAADTYDVNWYFGANTKNTDLAIPIAQVGTTGFGYSASTFESETYIYEAIVYDRVLSDADAQKVLNYLSNKWSAQNEDSASSVIATASTAATWTNNNIDKEGEGTTNIPGKQTGEYSIVRVGDREAIYLDKNYPMATWGSLVKFWFDASVPSGMTFATGDARSGGTVSSWVDITGTLTANTATSGASAVSYIPSRRGQPCIQGNGTNQALKTASVTYSTTVGHQRLMWAVVEAGADTTDNCILGLRNDKTMAFIEGSYTGDLYAGQPHLCAYDGTYTPVSVQDPRGKASVLVWRQTITGSDQMDSESWNSGCKLPTRSSVTWAYGAVTMCDFSTVGTFPSDGYIYEAGAIHGNGTSISDSEVDGLIRYLCEKYDVDYMPDTTPLDIGLHARSTSTVAQTDCALWYRSDKNLGETAWALHPLCAALHTNPSTVTMKATTYDPVPTITKHARKALDADVGDGLIGGNYNMAETTDFPAVDAGASWFVVGQANTDCPANLYPAYFGTLGGYRRFSTFDLLQIYAGNSAFSTYTDVGAYALLGGAYAFDDDGTGTPDGDPHTWQYWNALLGEVDSGAYSSFGNIAPILNNAGTATGTHSEVFVYKHVLTEAEYDNLLRYVRWRYNHPFTSII